MNLDQSLEQVKKLVAENKIGTAISQLEEVVRKGRDKKKLFLIKGRYFATKGNLLEGIVDRTAAEISFNNVRKDLLDFVDTLDKEEVDFSLQRGFKFNGILGLFLFLIVAVVLSFFIFTERKKSLGQVDEGERLQEKVLNDKPIENEKQFIGDDQAKEELKKIPDTADHPSVVIAEEKNDGLIAGIRPQPLNVQFNKDIRTYRGLPILEFTIRNKGNQSLSVSGCRIEIAKAGLSGFSYPENSSSRLSKMNAWDIAIDKEKTALQYNSEVPIYLKPQEEKNLKIRLYVKNGELIFSPQALGDFEFNLSFLDSKKRVVKSFSGIRLP